MAFPARLSTGAWDEFSANPDLRFTNIQNASAFTRQDDLKRQVEWKVISPRTAGEASAVCYYMARALQQANKVPVGFIGSNWGGTWIQAWIGASSLKTLPAYAPGIESLAKLSSNPAKAIADETQRSLLVDLMADTEGPLAQLVEAAKAGAESEAEQDRSRSNQHDPGA